MKAVIASAVRTPFGSFQGVLSPLKASEIGAAAIKEAVRRAGVENDHVDMVYMGNVLPAGMGQAPARQATIYAGLSEHTPTVTVSKVCGSGMESIIQAARAVMVGDANVVVAGGMESMTNAPYLLPKMRGGTRMGHGQVVDSMFLDGLEDAYEGGRLMGAFAEDCAEAFQFTREAQDAYALGSLERATAAQGGAFDAEIAPVTVRTRRGEVEVREDEQPGLARPDKIPGLRPAFREGGTVTAANASSISDGAAALLMAAADAADERGLPVRARVLGHATHAQAPGWFTTAPVPAARKLLDRISWAVEDVDLWEVNEAFAVVPMAFMRELGVDRDRVNVNGGACALGHPIGASGARIVVTLLHALEARGLKRGVAAICIGGGEGTAIAVERV